MYLFFFNDTATTEIYTLSLHDALPISAVLAVHTRAEDLSTLNQIQGRYEAVHEQVSPAVVAVQCRRDRKSTRLNSSHVRISYAVFCLKKKKKKRKTCSEFTLINSFNLQ